MKKTLLFMFFTTIMTKFVLHGGMASKPSSSNAEFYNKFVKTGDFVLLFPFSNPKENWNDCFDKDKERFTKNNPDKDLTFILASDDIPTLIAQISQCDVLYFRGGDAQGHLHITNQIDNLRDLLKDKTILGTSAGALMWGFYYYTQDFEEVRYGNGFLDCKMMVHYGSETYGEKTDEDRMDELMDHGEFLDVLTIAEEMYHVVEV